jgi:hypothetical protein
MILRGMGHEVLKSFLLFIFIYKIFYNLFYRKSHAPCPTLANEAYEIRILCRGMTKFLMPHFCPVRPEIRIFWRFFSKIMKIYFIIQTPFCQKWGKTGHDSLSCPDSKKRRKSAMILMQFFSRKKSEIFTSFLSYAQLNSYAHLQSLRCTCDNVLHGRKRKNIFILVTKKIHSYTRRFALPFHVERIFFVASIISKKNNQSINEKRK